MSKKPVTFPVSPKSAPDVHRDLVDTLVRHIFEMRGLTALVTAALIEARDKPRFTTGGDSGNDFCTPDFVFEHLDAGVSVALNRFYELSREVEDLVVAEDKRARAEGAR